MPLPRILVGVGIFAYLGLRSLPLEAGLLVVSQQNAASADTNPGTEAEPLKTISAAAAKVKAGDKVVIHGGDYRETVVVNASGTEKAPITFEAAPNEKPVIKGSDLLSGWVKDQAAIWKVSLPPFPTRGVPGKEASAWNTNDVRQVFSHDGKLLEARRVRRAVSRGVMEPGTFFCDLDQSVLYLWLEDSGSPVDHPPEVSRRGAWLCVNGDYVIVRGIEMRHASTTAIANWPAAIVQGNHDLIEDCSITWGDFAGISLSGTGNGLRRCLIACHGVAGVGGRGENHLIEDCRVLSNNVDRYNPAWHAGGAKLIPNFRHSTVRGNEFAYNLGPGLWLDGECDDNMIDGNFCHDNEGAGIMIEISSRNLVMNNICVANRNLLSGPYRDENGKEKEQSSSEDRIAPARWLKPYHAGDGRGIYVSTSPGTKVFYNTCYLNEGEGICVEGPPRQSGQVTLTTQDCLVINNISVLNRGSQLTLLLPDEPPGTADRSIVSDHNLLFSVGSILAKAGWDGASAVDLAQWQKASGQDLHSVDADPRFAFAVMNDFRLLASSPALRAGQPLSEVNHDYLNNPRGRESTAMGACETPADNYPRPLRE